MKSSRLLTDSFPSVRPREAGVALIIVLAMLVLLSGILVAFMTSATTERSAAQTASNGARARQIADSTVNLVIGQIRDATSSTDRNGTVVENMTWASQPGALRTYSGSLSATRKSLPDRATYRTYNPGSNDFVYKLYSSDRMKVTSSDYSGTDLPVETKIIEDWDTTQDKTFVDINEPVLSARKDIDATGQTVEPYYPVLDPRAAYNDLEKAADQKGIVEGFDASINTDPKLKMVDVSGSGKGEAVPYLPMPVKWLYVLQDGTVGDISLATAKNPAIGRTAFWTDDETCKLNINTASEGTFWDTPSVSTMQESGYVEDNSGDLKPTRADLLNLASSQPTRGEFQRYPGHPATTCLSPALGWLWKLNLRNGPYPLAPGYKEYKEALYQISGFTPFDYPTTEGGTRNSDPDARENKNFYIKLAGIGANKAEAILDIRTKHLYATIDEMLFPADRNTGGSKPVTELNPEMTPAALEKLRFFLTANSRAPEVNLFGRPRITMWPIHPDAKAGQLSLRTHEDDLFAFTSTVYKDPNGNVGNDKPYYITRQDATSATADIAAGTATKDMWDFVHSFTGTAHPETPGFGSNFETKYHDDRDQIITEIFDYSRSVNLVDTGAPGRGGNKFSPYTPRFFKEGVSETNSTGGYSGRNARSVDWSGMVVPLKVNNTQGLGRFVTLSEAALIFHRSTDNDRVPPTNGGSGNAQVMQAVLSLEIATTMPGFPAIRPTYFTKVRAITPTFATVKNSNMPGFTSLRTDMQFNTTPEYNICNIAPHEVTYGRGFMPVQGSSSSMHYFAEHTKPSHPNDYFDAVGLSNPDLDPSRNQNFTVYIKTFEKGKNASYKRQSQGGDTVTRYPYVSAPVPIPTNSPGTYDLTVEGGSFEIEIWSGEAFDDPRATLVQTATVDFSTPFTVTGLPTGGDQSFNSQRSKRFDGSKDGKRDYILADDVVRSVEYVGQGVAAGGEGDLRIGAMKPILVASDFRKVENPAGGVLYSSTRRQIHNLTASHGDPMANGGYLGGGRLAAGATFRGAKPPILPAYVNGVKRSDGGPGDFDRGLSKHMDGAFGNKVDEGNLNFNYPDASVSGRAPYFRGRGIEETGQSFFSPNRQLPSVAMIGSLPTGALAHKPWQTLLLRPDRETGTSHPGSQGLPDHIWLDYFQVPVIEPYAISEPFSTGGKVNMNYVIAPFGYAKSKVSGGKTTNPNTTNPRSYLRRDTALRGVLRSTFVMAVPSNTPEGAHAEAPVKDAPTLTLRYPIDLDKTLQEMEFRLNDQGSQIPSRDTTLFRSASEICDIDLYPLGGVGGDWNAYWTKNSITGDNMRERPYTHIFPRLTTKSNVYTVHMRCQAIRKSSKTDAEAKVFDPKHDQVVSEYRGSATIERFIDPNDPALRDYDRESKKVDPYYRFRVVSTKHFSPH